MISLLAKEITSNIPSSSILVLSQHPSPSVQNTHGSRVASSSTNTLSFCDHCEKMIKNFKRLNDNCRDLYEKWDFLKDKLKTLSASLADKDKRPLTLLVKIDNECKTLDPNELERK